MSDNHRKIVLANRPVGMPTDADFRLEEGPLPEAGPGQILVRADWLSLDPYMRGRMTEGPSYAANVEIGDVMTGEVAGEVVQSNDPGFSAGDVVAGHLGWQTHGVVQRDQIRKIDTGGLPSSVALGALGMPGRTAYFGFLDVGEARVGDTVVISAASGAVGAVVGQIAKTMGCRVVGIVGSQDKMDYITGDLGFDAAVNYKDFDGDARGLTSALKEACKGGIDVYFDNVGGWVTDAVMPIINLRARIVICGMISQYNLAEVEMAPRLTRFLLVMRAKMQGLIVTDFSMRYPEAEARLGLWMRDGQLSFKEDVTEGFENTPAAFLRLMRGENFGKVVVKI
jgi:NADPH-dependent curcumin reductase CurA